MSYLDFGLGNSLFGKSWMMVLQEEGIETPQSEAGEEMRSQAELTSVPCKFCMFLVMFWKTQLFKWIAYFFYILHIILFVLFIAYTFKSMHCGY